jgi:antitoxin (DNA-binding transcriptional repressor) of toxin-antitoxin stability system
MKEASIRDLRYGFKRIERFLRQGEEIQVTKHGRVIARLVPEGPVKIPDFMGRLRALYDKVLRVSGASLLRRDRSR